MQLLCLGDIALADRPFMLPAWEAPADFISGAGTRLLFNWERPLPEGLTAPNPRKTGPLRGADPARLLEKWKPGIAALANIHSLDAGPEGLEQTLCSFHQTGIRTIGAGLSPEEAARPMLWGTVEGELTILNWVMAPRITDSIEAVTPNYWPGMFEAGRLIQAVKQTSDWVLVVIDWNDEAFPHPLPEQREIARQLSELGADLIIGQNPYGVRGMEFMGACPVFYGLGSFYSSEQENKTVEGEDYTRQRGRDSLGVRFTFQHGRPLIYELFSFWNNQQEVLMDRTQRAFRRMNAASLALHDHPTEVYREWYEKERVRIDKWDGPLRLDLLRRGVTRTLRRLA